MVVAQLRATLSYIIRGLMFYSFIHEWCVFGGELCLDNYHTEFQHIIKIYFTIHQYNFLRFLQFLQWHLSSRLFF